MNRRELYIDTPDTLAQLLDELESVESIGLDTEFIREKTYYPLLCLLQIATPNAIACVDCVAELDLRALISRLLAEKLEWIVHSSRQDLEIIYQHGSQLPQHLIDTQVAAGLAGFAPQIGLQELLLNTLGISLPKDHTRTDWSRRPLPDAALEYARDDVRSLHALWDALRAKLDALGRLQWLEQDCRLLTSQPPLPTAEQIWLRLRGLRGLDPTGAAAALALVEWREARAQSRDRPRRWILGDEQVIAIARRQPQTVEEIRELPGLPARSAERLGNEILAVLRSASTQAHYQRACDLADDELPDKRRLRELQGSVKRAAAELGVHVEVLATKQDLVDLLAARRPPRIATTWRAAFLDDLVGQS